MNHIRSASTLLVFSLLFSATGCASHAAHPAPKVAAATQSGHYIAPDSVNLRQILPDPSKDGSPISRGEGDLLMAIQAESSANAKARMKSEETLTPWAFAEVLGPSFAKDHMPLTAAVLSNIEEDTKGATERAKDYWNRARPPQQDTRVQALAKVPKSASYPSGHATRAIVFARILAELAPSQAQALRERARLVALDRVIGGVHYPTDVAAGMALGDAIADQLLASPALKADLEKAKTEWAH
jgi:acid phosphatase (class A)